MKLIEILVVIVIVSVLVLTSSLSYKGVRDRAERLACTSNLRVLHQGFTSYYSDHGEWIQKPQTLGGSGEEFYDWIVGELYAYGTPRESWVCPVELRERKIDVNSDYFEGSYFPTMFGRGAQRPFKYAHQPWVIERRTNHKIGALMIFPDGSVHSRTESLGGY